MALNLESVLHVTSPLTVLLTLKGRERFTLRFLWHANLAKLPYHFLLADGEVNPELARLLDNAKELFPSLDIEYVRYPDDVDYRAYYKKILDAIGRVRTPYVVMADNDDFLIASGIDRSIEFLDAHPEYICCGGGLGGLSVYSASDDTQLTGMLNRLAYRYTIFDRSEDYSSSSVTERLQRGSRNWWSYYAVFRTPALATIWREAVEIDFSDLQLLEFFCAMRTLTLGKARSDGSTIAYLRQYGTSQRTSLKEDWVHHLLRSRFTSDFSAMADRISQLAGAADKVDPAIVAEQLRAICENWLRDFLRVYYGSLQTLKQWMRDHTPRLMHWLKNRRRYSVKRERSAFSRQLAQDGASSAYITIFERELAAVEETISGRDFVNFIQPHLPALIAHER